MSFVRRQGRGALLTCVLVAAGLSAASQVPASAQGAWSFQLEWEQPGGAPAHYELCVNGNCQWLFATQVDGERWRAPLPQLPLGELELVVRACGGNGCMGAPPVYVRVVRPNPRTPPVLSSSPP